MDKVASIQQQNKSTTGRDIAISTGVGLLGGATGVAAGYNMKPTAGQYAKALIKDNLESVDRYKTLVDGVSGIQINSKQERKQILNALKHMEEFLNNPKEFFKRLEYDFKSSFINIEEVPSAKLSDNSAKSFKDFFKNLPTNIKNLPTKVKDFFKNLAKGSKASETPEQFAIRLKELLDDKIKTIKSKEFKESVIDGFKNFDKDVKNALKPLVRGTNMIKWGAIGAGVASLMSAYLLCFAKDRDDYKQTEVTEQV